MTFTTLFTMERPQMLTVSKIREVPFHSSIHFLTSSSARPPLGVTKLQYRLVHKPVLVSEGLCPTWTIRSQQTDRLHWVIDATVVKNLPPPSACLGSQIILLCHPTEGQHTNTLCFCGVFFTALHDAFCLSEFGITIFRSVGTSGSFSSWVRGSLSS